MSHNGVAVPMASRPRLAAASTANPASTVVRTVNRTSSRGPSAGPGASLAGTRRTATAASTPNGTLIRKMLRRSLAPRSAPPTVGPIAGPRNSMMPASGETPLDPPELPSSMLIASGTSGAATKPCRTRAPTRNPASGASAHSADAMVNATTLVWYTGSVPNLRARYAVAARPAPSASR